MFKVSGPTRASWRKALFACAVFQSCWFQLKEPLGAKTWPRWLLITRALAKFQSRPVIRWQWIPSCCTYWWLTGGHRIIDQRRRHRKSRGANRPVIYVWLENNRWQTTYRPRLRLQPAVNNYILEEIVPPMRSSAGTEKSDLWDEIKHKWPLSPNYNGADGTETVMRVSERKMLTDNQPAARSSERWHEVK